MPRPSRRPDILQATMTLLVSHGFAGLSARDIAKQAGVTAASIYNHYATLNDLIDEALRINTQALSTDYVLILKQDLPDLVKLKSVFVRMISGYQADPSRMHLYQNAYFEGNDRAIDVFLEDQSIFRELCELIRRLAPAEDPTLVYYRATSMALGLVLLMPIQDRLARRPDHEREAKHLAEMALASSLPAIGWDAVSSLKVVDGRVVAPVELID